MDKGVPTLVLVRALIQSSVQYMHLLHFGTKMLYCMLPTQGEIVRECGAVTSGELPENEYHISINIYNTDIFATKVEQPCLTGQQTLYPTFISLDIRWSPQESMGGTFTLSFTKGDIKEIKWYNLIYLVLRGVSEKKLRVPTQSTKQVAHFLESWSDIKQRLVSNVIYLGGYQIETLVQNCTVEGAANIYLEREVFKVNKFIRPSHLEIYRISVPQYLESLDRKFNLAKANLRRMGVMCGHAQVLQ